MVRINLLPVRETLRAREIKYFIAIAVAGLVAVGAGMGVTYWILTTQINALKAEKASHDRKLVELKKQNEEINRLRAQVAELEQQVKTIDDLTRVRHSPAPFMEALAAAIPDEVWVSTINKSGGGFSLDGEGADNTVVVNFVRRLQNVKQNFTKKDPFAQTDKDPRFFHNVKLLQTVRGGNTVKFKITGNSL
jgi:type IV pilus assembly protein PilN